MKLQEILNACKDSCDVEAHLDVEDYDSDSCEIETIDILAQLIYKIVEERMND